MERLSCVLTFSVCEGSGSYVPCITVWVVSLHMWPCNDFAIRRTVYLHKMWTSDHFAWKEGAKPSITGSALILSPVASVVKLSLKNILSAIPTTLSAQFFLYFCLCMHAQTPNPLILLGHPGSSRCTLWPGHALVLLVLGSSFCVFQCPDLFQFTELFLPFRPLTLAEPIGPCRSTAAIGIILPNNLFIQQEWKGH